MKKKLEPHLDVARIALGFKGTQAEAIAWLERDYERQFEAIIKDFGHEDAAVRNENLKIIEKAIDKLKDKAWCESIIGGK